ncbi:MAG TPA: SDR family NAD(P)-dependent oxidoreductase [Gammaproteobacteria bacterium]
MADLQTRRGFLSAGLGLALAASAPALRSQSAPEAKALPRSPFGAESTAGEVTAGLDLSGKTAVVTGCNSGIGHETMRVLALRGAHVIGTARTPEKGAAARDSVRGKVTPVVLELADFDSVAECADEIDAMGAPIDVLICNAGMLLGELRQVRGIEMHFVVNHLGHFILVNRLLHRVLAAPQGRVVVVGSNNHKQAPEGGIQFDRLSGEGWGNYYHHSKLANGLFSLHLAKLLEGTRATSNCVTPGPVRGTRILRHIDASSDGYRKSPAQGAATQCYVATHPALAGASGLYFADCNPAEPSEYQQDQAMAARLWAVSEELTRGYV